MRREYDGREARTASQRSGRRGATSPRPAGAEQCVRKGAGPKHRNDPLFRPLNAGGGAAAQHPYRNLRVK